MYLKYLTITDYDNNLIRHVDFKKGINLIKGEESLSSINSSTNSLGKTTLLRAIDFCLCGKWSSFVFDKELKDSKNNTVFSFFKQALPIFELKIVKNFDSDISASLNIKRQLILNSKSKIDKKYFSVLNYLNGKEVSEQVFNDEIKKFLFDLVTEKPTLRQLLPKFIRTSDHQISNIIRYLHPSTSSYEYEIMHLFLFDFPNMELIHERLRTEAEIARKNQEIKAFDNVLSIGKREINDVKKIELIELQEKYDAFQISQEYERENDALNLIQEKITINKANISALYLDNDVWKKRLTDASSEIHGVDVESIEYMYKEANLYNVDLQKKFEETIEFHKKMLENEIIFINKALNRNSELIQKYENEHSILAQEYSELLNKLASSGSLTEYTNLGNQITHLTKEIAETESLISHSQQVIKELSELKLEFDNLTVNIQETLESMRRKITIFNRYFSEYSKILTESSYYLIIDQDKNSHFSLVPKCENQDSHVGDGSKQSIIIAFDLAYVSFCNDPAINLIRPNFFTQDKIEIIDINVLNKLISLVNKVDCQFIFPVISDKLHSLSEFNDENVILSLSENNKFFDIEGYNKRIKQLSSQQISLFL